MCFSSPLPLPRYFPSPPPPPPPLLASYLNHSGTLFDYLQGLWELGDCECGDPSFHDASFFRGDFRKGASEHVHVVEAQRCDPRHHWRIEYICLDSRKQYREEEEGGGRIGRRREKEEEEEEKGILVASVLPPIPTSMILASMFAISKIRNATRVMNLAACY